MQTIITTYSAKPVRAFIALALPILLAAAASAADGTRDPNRFGLRGIVSFNIKTEFTSATPTALIGAGPAFGPAGNADRFYDDGYVRIDASGNAAGQTVFWGYQNLTQYTPAGGVPGAAGSTMAYHSAPSPADGALRRGRNEGDPGFEAIYARDLGSFTVSGGRRAHWGLSGTFAYTTLERRDRGTMTGAVLQTTDTYTLPVGSIPLAPTFQNLTTAAGPGGLLNVSGPTPGDIFTRATAAAAATATIDNKLEANLYGFKIGPFLELPLTDTVGLSLGGGLAAVMVSQNYDYAHSLVVTGGATSTRAGTGRQEEWLLGTSLYARLAWEFRSNWSLNAGIEFQRAGRSTTAAGTQTASLTLNTVLTATLGLNYGF
jgi:hypothetical protein